MLKGYQTVGRFINNQYPCLVSSGVVGIVIMVLFACKGCLWFGNTTLATQDAYYQYVDFLSWYKDLLSGGHSLNYTITKELGGTAVPFFAYYLVSPFNLLFAFFPKGKAPAFIDLLFAIKSVVAAYSFSFFIKRRFSTIQSVFTVILGVSYGLMEYNIAQSFNMMWLDGVYMLPIMLLGVYYCVNNKTIVPLAVSTGITILLNWYTGGINCLFSILWFMYEEAEYVSCQHACVNKRVVITDYIRFLFSIVLGILLSSCLFLPSVIALRSGEGDSFDWEYIHARFLGNVLSVVQNHTIGSYSESGSVSLFCGSFALLSVIHMIGDKTVCYASKIRDCLMLFVGIIIFYFEPLVFAFSLFKYGEGYWYRYSYIGCFIVLFIAAKELNHIKMDKEDRKGFLKSGLILSATLLLLSFQNDKWNINHVYATIMFTLLMIILFSIVSNNRLLSAVRGIILIGVCATELFFNASYLVDSFAMNNGSEYSYYIENLEQSIDDIRRRDQDYYRISQTYHRQGNLSYSSTVNDSMAAGFAGISGYSSLSENIQTELESNMGYNCWARNLQVVLTSIIPTDSLLGVKYIISSYPIQGLVDIGPSPLSPECRLYENPYALPIVYSVNGDANNVLGNESLNPFDFVNNMYSNLLGRDVKVFEPVNTEYYSNGNIDSFDMPTTTSDTIYGFVNNDSYGIVRINGNEWIHLGEWQSQTLFYIPVWSDQVSQTVTLESSVSGTFSDTVFFRVDLEEFQRTIDELNSNNVVENLVIEDGYITCDVDASETSYLQTSIPSSVGWSAYVNGEKTEIISFANGLIRVPLQKGNNAVVLKYRTPGLVGGLGISLFAIAITIVCSIIERRRDNCISNVS